MARVVSSFIHEGYAETIAEINKYHRSWKLVPLYGLADSWAVYMDTLYWSGRKGCPREMVRRHISGDETVLSTARMVHIRKIVAYDGFALALGHQDEWKTKDDAIFALYSSREESPSVMAAGSRQKTTDVEDLFFPGYAKTILAMGGVFNEDTVPRLVDLREIDWSVNLDGRLSLKFGDKDDAYAIRNEPSYYRIVRRGGMTTAVVGQSDLTKYVVILDDDKQFLSIPEDGNGDGD